MLPNDRYVGQDQSNDSWIVEVMFFEIFKFIENFIQNSIEISRCVRQPKRKSLKFVVTILSGKRCFLNSIWCHWYLILRLLKILLKSWNRILILVVIEFNFLKSTHIRFGIKIIGEDNGLLEDWITLFCSNFCTSCSIIVFSNTVADKLALNYRYLYDFNPFYKVVLNRLLMLQKYQYILLIMLLTSYYVLKIYV